MNQMKVPHVPLAIRLTPQTMAEGPPFGTESTSTELKLVVSIFDIVYCMYSRNGR